MSIITWFRSITQPQALEASDPSPAELAAELQAELEADRTHTKDGLALVCAELSGPRRCLENVLRRTWWPIDLDQATEAQVESVRANLRRLGLSSVEHETYSCTPEQPRWRILVPLARPRLFTPTECDAITRYLVGDVPADRAVSRDMARGLYAPRCPAGQSRYIGHVPGAPLDVDSVLAHADPYPAPEVSPAARPGPQDGIASPELRARARAALAEHGPAVEGNGGDEHTLKACSLLTHDFGLADDEAWPLLAEWNATCSPPWELRDLKAKLRGSRRSPLARPPGRMVPQPTGKRPEIEWAADRLADAVTHSELALMDAGAELYVRGPRLVRPITDQVDASHGRRTSVVRLHAVDALSLRERLNRAAKFTKFDGRSGEQVVINPPRELAEHIVARVGDWQFPRVVAVFSAPTLRPDGTVLSEPGFDPATGILLVNPPEMPIVPEAPTRDEALAALARIEALFSEFPFVDGASRSVALSAMLTTIGRGAFSVTPGHGATASTPGTGKSYLWDVACAAVLGGRVPVIATGSTTEEFEKRLGATVLSGQPVISIDNASVGLGGDALCQIVERPTPQIRVLGKSEMVTVPARVTLLANGNNLQILGDNTRRWLLCSLEAKCERPEQRTFRHDPFEAVLANRGAYLADGLTVLRAYAVAGRPGRLPRLGSFEEWSDTVRSALCWLGRADPCASLEATRATDPLAELMRGVYAALGSLAQGHGSGMTASELLTKALTGDEELEPLKTASLNHGREDARTLGKWLSRHRGRIVGGQQLLAAPARGGVMRWYVVDPTVPSPSPGGDEP